MSIRPIEPTVGQLPPLLYTDETHQRASIVIATSVLLFAALLFVGPRLWVRQHPDLEQTGNVPDGGTTLLGLDDTLLVVATTLYTIHAALLFKACAQGLGDARATLSSTQMESIERIYYASNAFYVLSSGSCQASVAWLMVRVNSSRSPIVTRSMKAILGVVLLWTIAMFFLMLFACPTSHLSALKVGQCPHLATRWVILGVGNCCFEIAVTGVAIWNVWGLNTTFQMKTQVVALFALRLPTIPIIAFQLSSLHSDTLDTDPTLNITIFVCLTELVLSYSVCSANFPAFRRLTNDIRTDFGGFGVGTMNTFHTSTRSRRSAGGYLQSHRSKDDEPDSDTMPINGLSSAAKSGKRDKAGTSPSELTGQQEEYHVEVTNGASDCRSLASLTASEHASTEMIIRTRTDVEVRSDSRHE